MQKDPQQTLRFHIDTVSTSRSIRTERSPNWSRTKVGESLLVQEMALTERTINSAVIKLTGHEAHGGKGLSRGIDSREIPNHQGSWTAACSSWEYFVRTQGPRSGTTLREGHKPDRRSLVRGWRCMG